MTRLVQKAHVGRTNIVAIALLLAIAVATQSIAPVAAGAAVAPRPAWKLLAVTGPTNLPLRQSEVQQVTVEAEGGEFALTSTAQAQAIAVEQTVELEFTNGSTQATLVSGRLEQGQAIIQSTFLKVATTIASCSPGDCTTLGSSVTLSKAAKATGLGSATVRYREVELSEQTGTFPIGSVLTSTILSAGTSVTADQSGQTLKISAFPTSSGPAAVSATETTAPIAFNAPSADVQAALEVLPQLGAGSVVVTGGPGGTAKTPYAINFGGLNGHGTFADQDVPLLLADSAGLQGENPFAHVFTAVPGGAGTGELAIVPVNAGGEASNGPVTVQVGPLPAGIVTGGKANEDNGWTCAGSAGQATMACESSSVTGALRAGNVVRVPLRVEVAMPMHASVPVIVSGGGGGMAEESVQISVTDTDASPGIQAMWTGAFEADGTPSTQAGGHPFSDMAFFRLNTIRSTSGQIVPAGDPKQVSVDLPPGFVGDPMATARCPQAVLYECGADSAVVGRLAPVSSEFGANPVSFQANIYNDVPATGAAAEFTTILALPIQHLLGSVRSEDDFGIRVVAPEIPTVYKVFGSLAVLDGEPTGSPGVAWFRNATDCAEEAREGPAETLGVSFWQPAFVTSSATQRLQPVVGCDKLHFEPAFSLRPTSTQGSSGVGATAKFHLDQSGLTNPNALANPDLKESVVTLPSGLNVNPAQANGLDACTEAQVGYKGSGALPNPTRFNDASVTCPDGSKLGAVEATSPLLEEPLKGTVYLAAQEENPFHSLIALYLVFESERFGVTLKLPGKIETDTQTGQITATFDYVPQQPIEDLTLYFRGGGPRSEFATPELCGTYTTHGTWTPWSAPESGPPAQTSDSFTVSGGCSSSASTRPFHPTFEGGSTNPIAGSYSPLVIKIHRSDGEQELRSLDFTLPPGETGKLAGIPYCSGNAIAEAESKTGKQELATSSCPSASQIGTVDASAGVGGQPVHVTGKAYLAGPYRGAPLSAVVVTPAVAGPFDLGDVVIRSPLFVDPETSRITAKSDPIPTILRGIPLKIRSVAISIDRLGFTLNPTNCQAMSISASVGSSDGATSSPTNRFQVGNCESLAFKPRLKLSLKGSTKRAGHPALKAVLTNPKSGAYANIARAQVNLPHSEFIDQGNLGKTCTKPILLEGKCPDKSIYGRAKAWTPLLDEPLQGPVYLVGGYGYKLPALVAELNGQIRVVLKGKVDSGPNNGIRNTFEAVPDAPVEKFVLEMKGGPKYSLLVNSENLCAKPQHAIVRFAAQNGRVQQWKPRIANSCKKNRRVKGHKAHSRMNTKRLRR